MRRFYKAIFIVLCIIFLGLFAYYLFTHQGITECPDSKMIDNMPGTSKTSYYIDNGSRKEISDYDNSWVETNCKVPTQEVY